MNHLLAEILPSSKPNGSPIKLSDPLKTARMIVTARISRNRIFRDTLFGEPDWDMLLDLYIARLTNRQISVSSLCIAALVPPTTALRHISVLEQHGEIIRVSDPRDRRRSFLKMSDKTFGDMTRWITTLGQCYPHTREGRASHADCEVGI